MHQIKNNFFIINDFTQINELKINFSIEIIKILLKKLMKIFKKNNFNNNFKYFKNFKEKFDN